MTLQQIGVPCLVLQAGAELQPLAVGIKLQPHAVRGLHDLGLGNRVLGTMVREHGVSPADERAAFTARYKAAAGLAMEALNAAPPTIAPGARVGG